MLIGIAGQMEAGKSSVANILAEQRGFEVVAFADFLKNMCQDVFDLTDHQMYTTEGKAAPFDKPIILTKEKCRKILYKISELKMWPIKPQHLDEIYVFSGTVFKTPRHLLQIVGTEICRHLFVSDFHAQVLFEKIRRSLAVNIAIADARFPNEREYIKNNGGKNILVIDPDQHKCDTKHESENSLGAPEDYDFVLFNDKTKGMDYLCTAVLNMHEYFVKNGDVKVSTTIK